MKSHAPAGTCMPSTPLPLTYFSQSFMAFAFIFLGIKTSFSTCLRPSSSPLPRTDILLGHGRKPAGELFLNGAHLPSSSSPLPRAPHQLITLLSSVLLNRNCYEHKINGSITLDTDEDTNYKNDNKLKKTTPHANKTAGRPFRLTSHKQDWCNYNTVSHSSECLPCYH